MLSLLKNFESLVVTNHHSINPQPLHINFFEIGKIHSFILFDEAKKRQLSFVRFSFYNTDHMIFSSFSFVLSLKFMHIHECMYVWNIKL